MRIQKLTNRLARAARKAITRVRPTNSPDSPMSFPDTAQRTDAFDSSERVGRAADGHSSAIAPDRKQRVGAWRRRVLVKKGARLHAVHRDSGDRCSLAMLDVHGIVVAWYDESHDGGRAGAHIIDRHVSQFYVPADLAANLPGLNLLSAAMCGDNTQHGWRRQPNGTVIWGMTVITAIMLKDGRLQGFTHVIRPAEAPRVDVQMQLALPSLRKSVVAGGWGMKRRERAVAYVGAAA